MKPKKKHRRACERFPVGSKVGNWTVLEHVGRIAGRPSYFSRCRCDCGRECCISNANLSRGGSKHCQQCSGRGAWRDAVVVGARFGSWSVAALPEVEKMSSGAYYVKALCRCKCGFEGYVDCNALMKGNSKGCKVCCQDRNRKCGVLGRDGMKKCGTCRMNKPADEFYRCKTKPDGLDSRCKVCDRLSVVAEKYGLSAKEYAGLLESAEHCCQLCGRHASHFEQGLHIDHIHGIPGKDGVRGILCRACNTAIGMLQDNPGLMRRAADYVEQGGFAKLNEAPSSSSSSSSTKSFPLTSLS